MKKPKYPAISHGIMSDQVELSVKQVAGLAGRSLGQIYAAIKREDLKAIPGSDPLKIDAVEAKRFAENLPKRGRKPQSRVIENGNQNETVASDS